MSLRLADLSRCFDGVIPSVIATAAADGTPNVSYLSHVVRVDADHIALSNQFFAKTAANVRANPQVTVLLVDGLTGAQFALDVSFVRPLDHGPLFERIARQLAASSAQAGMADVMRLRSADVFRVKSISAVAAPEPSHGLAAQGGDDVGVGLVSAHVQEPPHLPTLADAARAILQQDDAAAIIDTLLMAIREALSCSHALVLIRDQRRGRLVTTGGMGYAPHGIGSEVSEHDGLVGAAMAQGRTARISDLSRVRRFGAAMGATIDDDPGRMVALPRLAGAMSQMATPLIARGHILGAVFVESRAQLAFSEESAAALELLAGHAAMALWAIERDAQPVGGASAGAADGVAPPGPSSSQPQQTLPPPAASPTMARQEGGRPISVKHHAYDDSIFIDGVYIVKGVAGALLQMMLQRHLADGRTAFSNRELRLAAGPRMPDIKDNLETRLLLLRRRLEEKQAPIRLLRTGRGQIQLDMTGAPELEQAP